MNERYEINKSTLVLIPKGEKQTKVYEEEREFIINKTPLEIIDDSCRFFGSSYLGRFEGTKSLVGYNYKSPIIIEETNKIIFFPTTSPRLAECIWVSLNNIKDYLSENNYSLLILKNNKKIKINISFNTLENQILRSTKLWCTLDRNKKELNH